MPEEQDVQPESSPGTEVDVQPESSPVLSPQDTAVERRDYAEYERLANDQAIEDSKASASAKPAEPAPASQPVQKQEPEQKRQPKPKNAATRIQELLAENSDLRKRIEGKVENGVTRPSPPAQPEPKPIAQPVEATDDPKPVREHKPDGTAWKDWDEYSEARDQWLIREGARHHERTTAERTAKEALERQNQDFRQKMAVVAKIPDYQDFETVALNPKLPVSATMRDVIYRCEHGPEILYHLGKNPQVAQQLVNGNPAEVGWFLGQLDAAFGKMETPKSEPAPTKRTTRTPPPATDLAARNSAPADEEEAAVANRDFRSFERAANQKGFRR